jgi:hypothetical protein
VTVQTASTAQQLSPRHQLQKSVRAAEQDRPDVVEARAAWAQDQADLDADRLVFIDKTATSTNMARPTRPMLTWRKSLVVQGRGALDRDAVAPRRCITRSILGIRMC